MVTDQPRTSSGKPDAPTRVAIVGAGYVSAHHLRALKDLPFIRLVGIYDRDQARARAMARRFGVADVYPTLDAMAAAKPEVIHILTPPVSHCARQNLFSPFVGRRSASRFLGGFPLLRTVRMRRERS